MEGIEVLVELENRSFPMDLPDCSFESLRDEFVKFCKSDEVLKQRLILYSPTFNSMHPKFKRFVELKKNRDIEDGQVIRVQWSPFRLEMDAADTIPGLGASQNSDSAGNVIMSMSQDSQDNVVVQINDTAPHSTKDSQVNKGLQESPKVSKDLQRKINDSTSEARAAAISKLYLVDRSAGREMEVLTGNGLVKAIAMEQDGHCLFAAVVNQMHPDIDVNSDQFKRQISKYRKISADYIRDNRKQMKIQLEYAVKSVKHSRYTSQKTLKGKVDAYIRNLEKGSEWGGAECLEALANRLNVDIIIYQERIPHVTTDTALSYSFKPKNEAGIKTIILIFRVTLDPEALQQDGNPPRNHYDSFKAIIKSTAEMNENESRAQSYLIPNLCSEDSSVDRFEVAEMNENETRAQSDLIPNLCSEDSSVDRFEVDEMNENESRAQSDLIANLCSEDSPEDRFEVAQTECSGKESDTMSDIMKTTSAYFKATVWNDMSDYEKESWCQYYIKHTKLTELGLVTTPFKPCVHEGSLSSSQKQNSSSKSARTPSKSLEPSTCNQLRKSSRGSSTGSQVAETDDSEEVDNALQDIDQNITQEKKKRCRVKRGKELFGQQLTANNCMPNFSEASEATLATAKPNMYLVLADIKAHIAKIKGKDVLISTQEYDNLCSAVIQKHPVLQDQDDPGSWKKLKRKIVASISGARSYQKNKKPRMQEAKLARAMAQHQVTVVIESTSEKTVEDMDDELSSLGSLEDKPRVRLLISKTITIRDCAYERAQKSPLDVLESEVKKLTTKYPHYQDPRLTAYEQSVRANIPLTTMIENYNKIMEKLSKFLNRPAVTHLQQLDILDQVYKEVTPDIYLTKDTPPIQVVDELEAQGHRFINTAHTIHAPCVLVVSKVGEDGSMVTEKSYLKAYDQVVNSMEQPSAFDVVLQLLAPYFWMGINYPPSYKSIMRFLELAIHGALSRETLRQQAHAKYHSFMWRLNK